MISAELADWFNARWNIGMGAIDGQDIAFIDGLIGQDRPRNVVEIGCASGLSTSVLASLMSSAGGGTLNSFDLMERFYANPAKEVGYLLDEAPPHPGVNVAVHPGKTCLDVADHVTGPVDLCFIDAAHKHPWPLIDTLAILPLMKPGGLIIHHDLQMFRSGEGYEHANGPKMVFILAPPATRIYPDDAGQAKGRALMNARGISHNIFALRLPDTRRAFAAQLSEGFFLGWDKKGHRLVPQDFATRFSDFLAGHYGPYVGQAWAEGLRRYGDQTDGTAAVPHTSLPHRILRKIRGR